MLSLSKKTDYALLALSHLADIGGVRAVNTREIAEQYDIPVELLAKILQHLVRARLISSLPGPTGGYRLARPAEQISVGMVIEAIDGPPAITQCMKVTGNACEQMDKCTIRKPLARINARILQMLHLVSLAEINSPEDEDTSSPIVAQLSARRAPAIL